jgi:branched-chain amino acid transport system permease protein
VFKPKLSLGVIACVVACLLPALASDYLLRAVLTPLAILSLAALGLNVLVGYCGQISLGTGAFMAVGAYGAFNVLTRIDGVPLVVAILSGGLTATVVGLVFGMPSLRIRGLYLAVATLAVQFFVDWALLRFPWFTNNSSSGSASVGHLDVFGWQVTSAAERYYLCLAFLFGFGLLVRNMVRAGIGREWMAVRDMDVAAAVVGIRPVHAKLTAFAISSCIAGVAGALFAFVHLGAWEPSTFGLDRSLQILFMVIVGGLGSLAGPFLGATFIVTLPLVLDHLPRLVGLTLSTTVTTHVVHIAYGALIVFFLIKEPHGLERWRRKAWARLQTSRRTAGTRIQTSGDTP